MHATNQGSTIIHGGCCSSSYSEAVHPFLPWAARRTRDAFSGAARLENANVKKYDDLELSRAALCSRCRHKARAVRCGAHGVIGRLFPRRRGNAKSEQGRVGEKTCWLGFK